MPNSKENCMNREELTADFNFRANRVVEIVNKLGIGKEDLSELNVQLTHMANDQYWLGMVEANTSWKRYVSCYTVV